MSHTQAEKFYLPDNPTKAKMGGYTKNRLKRSAQLYLLSEKAVHTVDPQLYHGKQ